MTDTPEVTSGKELSAVTKQSRAVAKTQQAQITNLMQAITDPSVSIEKMERAFELHDKIIRREAELTFNRDFAALQPKLPTVGRNGKISFTDKNGVERNTPYAKYEDIVEAIRDPLQEYGFALSFSSERAGDQVITTGKLIHRDGHHTEVVIPIALDVSGSKNNQQAVISSLSYGKRAAVGMLLNIVTRGLDDDGKNAGAMDQGLVDGAQIKWMVDQLKKLNAPATPLLDYMKVEKLDDIPKAAFPKAVTFLKARDTNNGQAQKA